VSVSAAREPAIEVGTIIDGRYRVDEPIGAGGFATVHAGHHLTLGVRVAIKVLRLDRATSAETREELLDAFMEEARLVMRLRHDRIVRTLDQGIFHRPPASEPVPYVVLEWCGDETLKHRLLRRKEPCSIPEALAIVDGIADGMAHAHEAGVVHRDLKPSNVMVTEGPDGALNVRVIDFGVAKLFEGKRTTSGDTRSGSAGNFTPAYAAPEQLAGLRTGPWTDVHAIGLILGELLTLRSPFSSDGKTLGAVDPERPTPARHGIDVGPLEPIIARAVALRPDDRYRDAGELRDALRRAGGMQVAKGSAPPPTASPLAAIVPETTESPISRTHRTSGARARSEVPPSRGSSRIVRLAAGGVLGVAIGAVFVAPRLWSHRIAPNVTAGSFAPTVASVGAQPSTSASASAAKDRLHLADLTVEELARRVAALGLEVTQRGSQESENEMLFVHYRDPDGATGTAYVNRFAIPKGTPREDYALLLLEPIRTWIEFDRQQGLELIYGIEGDRVLSFAGSAKEPSRARFAALAKGLVFEAKGSSFGTPDPNPAEKVADAKPLWRARSIDDVTTAELASRLHLVDAIASKTTVADGRSTIAFGRGADAGTLDVFRGDDSAVFTADLRSRGVTFALARGAKVTIVMQGPKRLGAPALLPRMLEGLGPFASE
jgi:serine/threonine protein kinase